LTATLKRFYAYFIQFQLKIIFIVFFSIWYNTEKANPLSCCDN